ncbi:heat shock 70 kDa protein 14-like [Branchiostoma floridae]|uniref:Heat shock 70 kDa protein 14 n=1 Tax=Branchiostoma floridae TaxID=7739 RepID=A0A9J7L725_BRAFL|nr:heat shock 70 kDa protein 14-like [Branchiostoma floridae]
MAASIGISFGATSACLATQKDGKADVVANEDGQRVTPAMVANTDTEMVVGLAAKQGWIRNAANTITKVKQILGKKFADPAVEHAVKTSSCKIVEKDSNPMYAVQHNGKTKHFSPTHITTVIFRKLMDIAQSKEMSGGKNAVVAVPLNFDEQQKDAVRRAATEAGFHVLRTIPEPVAAAYAHNIGQESPKDSRVALVYRVGGSSIDATVLAVSGGMYRVCGCEWGDVPSVWLVALVYRVGGSSIDATVLAVSGGMYRVLASVRRDHLGGDQLNRIIVDYFVQEFKRKWKADVTENTRAMAKLNTEAEKAKQILSTMPKASCHVESLHEGIDFQCDISRARFESIALSLLQQCLEPIEEAISQAEVKKQAINMVVLCGGSTKIPKLQKLVQDCVQQAEVLNSVSPDEVIAMGAAKQAALLSGKGEENALNEAIAEIPSTARAVMLKVCFLSDKEDLYLYLSTVDDSGSPVLKTLVPARSPIPLHCQHTFPVSQQLSACCVELYEGEQDDTVEKAVLLAKIVLSDLPTGDDDVKVVSVVLHFRREGSLHVTCTEKCSGQADDVTIECATE